MAAWEDRWESLSIPARSACLLLAGPDDEIETESFAPAIVEELIAAGFAVTVEAAL